MSDADAERDRIATTILRLAAAVPAASTICPSAVARALMPEEPAWRALMPEVRRIAGELEREGLVRVTRAGHPADPETARGPIRLGRI